MDRADAPVLSPALLQRWPLPQAQDGDDKHDRGTALVVGGDVGTPGAVLLAGLAALRVGAGRLQLATVRETAVALAVAVPEALVVGRPAEELGQVEVEDADGVLVGPGLMDVHHAGRVLESLVPRLGGAAMVVDALALHALSSSTKLPERCILTPNLGELAALDGGGDDSTDKQARRVAERTGAVVATQDWVASPGGDLWRNEAGSVGLATSGSGDVLAGAALGLLCRGADPDQAACWATYVHSAAGQRLAAENGRTGYLARELIDALPQELLALSS